MKTKNNARVIVRLDHALGMPAPARQYYLCAGPAYDLTAVLPIPPNRNLRTEDRMTSFPHPASDAFTAPPPRTSCLPTSRPITYPAPNPTTETRTTTPADTTHVMSVGLISVGCSSVLFFLLARAPRRAEAVRLGFPVREDDRAGDGEEAGGGEAAAAGGLSFMSSASGTSRSSIGWLLVPAPAPAPVGLGPCRSSSFLFRPRAAAAQERSVVREARSAASLSAWYDGDM